MSFYKYCPKCAKVDIPEKDICDFCETELIETNIQYKFIDWKANSSKIEMDIIYKFQIEDNPLFDKKIYLKRIKGDPLERRKELDRKKEQEEKDRYRENMIKLHGSDTISNSSNAAPNVPKCPTCQSTNIKKISVGSKAVGFATVGVFSSNFGKTMVCNNCGYKW